MTGITHKQAGRYMRADLDGLLTAAQSRDLAAHLDECEACRLESKSLSSLTARLQSGFRTRWDTQHGPSTNVIANVRSQTRRIIMQKRIDLAFNIFGGVVTLLVLAFVVSTLVSQFKKKPTAANGTQTNVPVSTLRPESLIAYINDTNGDAEIYIMHADGSNPTNLTNHSGHDVNPIWSPDGKHILFESNRTGFNQIYIMNADGSNLTQLTSEKADYAIGTKYGHTPEPWSPDGEKIIYSQRVPGEDQWTLYVMDADGSNKTALTGEPGMYTFLGWSPDGHKIVYQDQQFEGRIRFVDSNGANYGDGPFFEGDRSRRYSQIHWETPEQFIALGSNNEQPTWGLWNLTRFFTTEDYTNYNGSNPILVTSNSPIITIFDKTYVVEDQNSLTWFTYDGAPIPLSPWDFSKLCNATDPLMEETFHFISPDKQQDFVSLLCPEGNSYFFLMSTDGTEIHQLGESLAQPLQVNAMEWSPDGSYVIATVLNINNESTELYRFDIQEMLNNPSTSQTQLTADGTYKFGATWQPLMNNDIVAEKPTSEPTQTSSHNGLIAYASENKNGANKNMDIFTMRADGSDVTNLTNSPSNDTSPAWSPDGQKIAFVSERTGNADIFVMNSDGSGAIQLTDNLGYDGNISWSPDGQKIVYSSDANDPNAESQLMIMNADGSNKISLTSEPGLYYFLSWSPDGQSVVYEKSSTNPNGTVETSTYSVNINGIDQRELYKGGGIESVRWEDTSNFSGIVYTQLDSRNWYLYRFNIDGIPARKLGGANMPGSNYPIDGWLTEGARTIYITKNTTTWFWHDNQKKVSDWLKWNFASSCKDYSPKDVFQHDADHVMSPDGKHLFVIVTCNEGVSYFYLVSIDGSEIKELGNMPTPTSWQVLDTTWSPDGKYVIMTSAVAFPNNQAAYMDFYLFDIEKMLNDPSTKPFQLTTDGAFKFGAAWQPIPNNAVVAENPTSELLTFSLTVNEAETLAGFDMLEPTYIPAGYTLEDVAYDPQTQKVAMKYISQENEGVLFIYQQRSELISDPALQSYVDPVSVGGVYGEYLHGAWIYNSPNTTSPTFDPQAETYSLTWQDGDMLHSIIFIGGETVPPIQLRGLLEIAESLK